MRICIYIYLYVSTYDPNSWASAHICTILFRYLWDAWSPNGHHISYATLKSPCSTIHVLNNFTGLRRRAQGHDDHKDSWKWYSFSIIFLPAFLHALNLESLLWLKCCFSATVAVLLFVLKLLSWLPSATDQSQCLKYAFKYAGVLQESLKRPAFLFGMQLLCMHQALGSLGLRWTKLCYKMICASFIVSRGYAITGPMVTSAAVLSCCQCDLNNRKQLCGDIKLYQLIIYSAWLLCINYSWRGSGGMGRPPFRLWKGQCFVTCIKRTRSIEQFNIVQNPGKANSTDLGISWAVCYGYCGAIQLPIHGCRRK